MPTRGARLVFQTSAPETLQPTGAALTLAASDPATITTGADHLAFIVQPTATNVNTVISPPVVVEVQDSANQPIAQAGQTIDIAINSGVGTLSGTVSQDTVASGRATFNNLEIDSADTFTLIASSPTGLSPITTQPDLAADGIALGIQPVIDTKLPGVTVTASLASGTGTLANVTAVANDLGVATFQRLRIDGGVGVAHTITFSATGFGPVTSDPLTPVAAPATGDVAVDESTDHQLWEGIYPATGLIAWEIDSAIYAADKDAVLDLAVDALGPMTVILSWRPGMQSNTNWVSTLGPWPSPTNWPTLRTNLRADWQLGAPIWSDFILREVEELVIPLRQKAAAAGVDLPRTQLLMQTHDTEPVAFRPTQVGGDGDGSRYAAIVLKIFQDVENTHALVIDEVAMINEPNLIGNWNESDEALAMSATKALLNANGYFPRFVSAQNSNETTAVSRFDGVAAAQSGVAAGIPSAITYHRYGRLLSARQEIASRTSDAFPALMTEWIINAGTVYQSFEETVTEANASAWALLAGWYPNNPDAPGTFIYMTGTGAPVLTSTAHDVIEYLEHLRYGARRIGCTETHASIGNVYAWVNPDGKHVVQIRSTGAIAGAVTVSGIPAGTYAMQETVFGGVERASRGTVVVTNGGQASISGGTITGAGILSLVRT